MACARQADIAAAKSPLQPSETAGPERAAAEPAALETDSMPGQAPAGVAANRSLQVDLRHETPTTVAASSDQGPIQAMMDIEANLSIEVRDITAVVKQVRALVAACAGQIIDETLQDSRHERPTAHLTVRIPSSGAFDFLGQIEASSVVRARHLSSRDVGKEYFDATLRVRSLEQVLSRYQTLLSTATTIDETLKIEEQIARVSSDIEKIKGELRWLKDRVARATVHLEIFAKGDWVEPVVTPEAKLYPGLRAAGSMDWRGDRTTQYGLGAGLSLRFSRHFSIDFDGFQNTKSPRGALDLSLLTLGGEFYSDFLGAGRRRWLNPYLGLRGGYARVEATDQFVVGGTIGVEIFRAKAVTLELDSRFLEAFGGRLGNHLVIVPALGANFAF